MKSLYIIALCSFLYSCTNASVDNFYHLYEDKNYFAALAQGEIILKEQGALRSMWINLNSDARLANCNFLNTMVQCATIAKTKKTSMHIDLLIAQLESQIKTQCKNYSFSSAMPSEIKSQKKTKTINPQSSSRASRPQQRKASPERNREKAHPNKTSDEDKYKYMDYFM